MITFHTTNNLEITCNDWPLYLSLVILSPAFFFVFFACSFVRFISFCLVFIHKDLLLVYHWLIDITRINVHRRHCNEKNIQFQWQDNKFRNGFFLLGIHLVLKKSNYSINYNKYGLNKNTFGGLEVITISISPNSNWIYSKKKFFLLKKHSDSN